MNSQMGTPVASSLNLPITFLLCGISPHFVRSGDIALFIYLYATKCSHVVSSSKREDPGNEKAVCLSPEKLPPVCFAAIICFIFVKCSWLV